MKKKKKKKNSPLETETIYQKGILLGYKPLYAYIIMRRVKLQVFCF